jgi:4-amino-4-deoxy-L-arabinose transferase-like glycosyltransferase
LFIGLLLAGLVLRVLATRSTWGQPDGDDAMVMLMSLRASQGHFSLLFWGGNYGGAIITWVEAPLIVVFGMKIWLFKIVDMAMNLIAVLLLRSIGRRFLSRTAADVAAGTFWFFPALWLFWSSREYIFWLPAIVFALATCLFILRWFESRSRRDLLAGGLCAGLSIWSYPLVFPLVGPALGVLICSLRKDRKALFGVGVAGLIGVAPWLAYFALHGSAASQLQTVTGSRATALKHTVTEVLPTALIGGERRAGVIWALTNAAPHRLALLGAAIYAGTAAYTVVAVARREIALAVCGTSVLLWPFVLIVGHVPISPDTYRYGLIPVAPLLLLAANLLSKVRLAPALAVAALVLVTFTIARDTSTFATAPSCNEQLNATSRFLIAQHRTAVWASYWVSAPLELCSAERVTVASIAPVRDHLAEVRAASARRSTFVVIPGKTLDSQLQTWTRAHHATVTRTTESGFATWEFDTKVTPAQIGLNSAL